MIKNIFFLSIFVFSTSAIALPSKTVKCPSIESIQSAPYVKFYQYEPFWMLEKANNFYDTENEWSLLMMYILADNENDAILKANEAQKNLRSPGLYQHDQHWHCVYSTDGPTPMATAVSPPGADGF